MNSIWSSLEGDAWARDFNYEAYLEHHKSTGCLGTPLDAVAYRDFCHVLESVMIRSIGQC